MGIQERKAREKLQRKGEILEAARKVFESKGFLKTTLADVASEAEISVGLIYRYFQSKEDIFASLALKGAEEFDRKIAAVFKRELAGKRKSAPPAPILKQIVEEFFGFYGPYGEYFDLLMYSYKGMKEVQIHGPTMTRLMAVTLASLDKLKNFILENTHFKAKDEDEALRVVFLLWGTLLGCHKLFDTSGRGHLFAYGQQDFIEKMILQVLEGLAPGHETVGQAIAVRPPTLEV